MKTRTFWDVALCSFSGVDYFSIETTLRYIPEGSNLHTRCRENFKSYVDLWMPSM
jgi:hypothetical protein